MARRNSFCTSLGAGALLCLAVAGCSTAKVDADAGVVDAGPHQTVPDAGPIDTGPVDAGPVDAGADDAGLPDAGPTGLPLSQFQAQYINAWCSRAARCIVGTVFDTAACVAEQTAAANGYNGAGTIVALVGAGSVDYDEMGALDCVNDLRALDCTAPFKRLTDVPSCADTLTGHVGDSLRCVADVACVPGEFCFFSSAFAADSICGGFCGAMLGRCSDDTDCAAAQICASDNTCQNPAVPPGGQGDLCGTHDRCEPGLGCFLDDMLDTPANVCEPYTPVTQGGPVSCDITGACPTGRNGALQCAATVVSGFTTTACYPPPNPTAADAACDRTKPHCTAGLACVPNDAQTDGVCAAPKQLGDACSHVFQCGGGASATWCDETAGKCVARPQAGVACAKGPGTPPAYLCDSTVAWCNGSGATPTCLAYVAPGGSCSADAQCGPPWSGSTCVAGDGGSLCAAVSAPSCAP